MTVSETISAIIAALSLFLALKAEVRARRAEEQAARAEGRAIIAEQRAEEAHQLLLAQAGDHEAELESFKLFDQLKGRIASAHYAAGHGTHAVVDFPLADRAHRFALVKLRGQRESFPIVEVHERDGSAQIMVWTRHEYFKRFGRTWVTPKPGEYSARGRSKAGASQSDDATGTVQA